jgi:hypothetical protein
MASDFTLPPIGPGAPTAARAPRRAGAAAGGFAPPDPSALEPATAAAISPPTAPASVRIGLLHLQTEAAETDERTGRRARAVLRGLTTLQLRLLSGEPVTAEALLQLRSEARDLSAAAANPRLAAVVRALALRVEVELARRLPGPDAA